MRYPLLIVLCASLALPAEAASRSSNNFVKHASIGSTFEIQSSELALEKSENEAVKEFAERMVEDHSKAAEDLKKALESSDADSSYMGGGLDDKHQKQLDKLQNLSGAAFDKRYIDAQIVAHNEAVDLFGNYARNGKDRALQAFAAQTLPTLKEHQAHVRELSRKKR